MDQNGEAALGMDFSTVLVVARSPINRIVIAKIVERSSLRPLVEAPETAGAVFRTVTPGAVVLDGGVDNKECDRLLPTIATARSNRGAPVVILLSNRIGTPQSLNLSATIDAVVAKPITPEKLQPVLERLIAMARA